jgi:hypothetical protein
MRMLCVAIGILYHLRYSRMYTLRAKNDEEATQWVTVLRKLRQQGITAAQKEAEARGRPNPLGLEPSTLNPNTEATWIKSSNMCRCCPS